MKKKFQTYQQQINQLKSKGIIIKDEEHALHTLKHVGYFALINGYKRPFKGSDGKYISGTTFEDIEQLYQFDETLRTLTLEHILSIERRVKSSIAYHFAHDFTGKNQYFNVNNFDYSNNDDIPKIQEINRLVSVLIGVYSDNKHSYIEHYKKNYDGEIPLWVLINAMTFGQVSKMYSLLKEGTQQKISGDFHMSSHRDMGKILNMITLFRNVCAHNERLYDYETRSEIALKYITAYMGNNGYTYEKERKRYFGLLGCCRSLIQGREGCEFIEKLDGFIHNAPIIKNRNIGKVIMKEMGLTKDWTKFKNRI